MEDLKKLIRKFWNFVWHGESFLSYLTFVVLAFIILKFVLFPGFLYATGLSDIAAVVSPSMEHGENIDYTYHRWLKFHNFSEEEISEWPYQRGLNVGDVIVVKGASQEEIEVGDVILFYPRKGNQIVHRLVYKEEVNGTYYYTTKGDANAKIGLIESNVTHDQVKGKVIYKIPWIGYPRVFLSHLLNW